MNEQTIYAQQLSVKEQTSGTIWMVIAILQLIIGVLYAWPVLIIGVLNAFSAKSSFTRSKKVLNPYPGMVLEYEKQLTSLIVAMVYNLLIGGLIGVAGCIYDYTIRNFVLMHRNDFSVEVSNG